MIISMNGWQALNDNPFMIILVFVLWEFYDILILIRNIFTQSILRVYKYALKTITRMCSIYVLPAHISIIHQYT